jgi:hypothetical protein
MFCPQCGQQQASEELKFCPRCGFQLEGVAGLLATGGAPPAGGVGAGDAAAESPRRKGARLGAKLMLFGIFLGPIFAVMHPLLNTPSELSFIGVIVFMAGLLRLTYALIFEEGPFRLQRPRPQAYVPPAVTKELREPARGAAELPPRRSVPARSYEPPLAEADTAEIVGRPSVTDGTTRLLDGERDASAR